MKKFYSVKFKGPHPQIAGGIILEGKFYASETELIKWAANDVSRHGETLQDLAGIKWVENATGAFGPERDFLPGEELKAALTQLASDGYIYDVQEEKP